VGDPRAGFLGANLVIAWSYVRYWRRRARAVLVWPPPPARYSALPVVISVGLGVLIVYKLIVLKWQAPRLFGEGMMLAYYGYLLPLSRQIRRGFFEDGLGLDRGFAPWDRITGLTWHDDPVPALLVVTGHKQRAGRLTVPPEHYGEARRLLRDRIAAHDLHIARPVIDLGGHDERDDI
jgi:hypothetical protein